MPLEFKTVNVPGIVSGRSVGHLGWLQRSPRALGPVVGSSSSRHFRSAFARACLVERRPAVRFGGGAFLGNVRPPLWRSACAHVCPRSFNTFCCHGSPQYGCRGGYIRSGYTLRTRAHAQPCFPAGGFSEAAGTINAPKGSAVSRRVPRYIEIGDLAGVWPKLRLP
jgi:hypothetical protein